MISSAVKDIKLFSTSLCDEKIEGYNQILKTNSNFKVIAKESKENFNNLIETLKEIEKTEGNLEDIYIQINTTFIPVRQSKNVRQFRALYIDLDDQENNEGQCFYEIWVLVQEGVIPEPSLVIASGRGVHLYWIIENAPIQAWHTWQQLEDFLYCKLKHLGADKRATDSVRLLRIPGTVNSKNNAVCRIMRDSKKRYSMRDLREEFLKPYEIKKTVSNKRLKDKNECKVINNKFFNSYSLHRDRVEDLMTLLKLRNYKVKGYRNSFIHLFAYWRGIYNRDLESLKNEILDFNNKFKEPLKLSEINSIVRSVDRAVDRFLNYQNGLYSGEVKRVSKAMIERGGYWYTNARLIEMLGVSEEEQGKLKTIIGTDEKYKRKNKKRNKARRNEEGLTKKQAELKELYVKAKVLKDEGLSQRAIARELNVSEPKVRRIFKNNKL